VSHCWPQVFERASSLVGVYTLQLRGQSKAVVAHVAGCR